MICPKCGTEIKEGYLYCQTCGEEVIMVPDYEVEIEAGIEETISEVAGIIADEVASDTETGDGSIQDIIPPLTTEPASALGDTKPYDLPKEPVNNSNDTGRLERLLDSLSEKIGDRKNLGPVLLIAAALLMIVLIAWGTHKIVTAVKSYYSYDEQYAKAEEEFKRQEYESVVNTARHVISIKPEDEKARLLLADSYYALEKYDESIAVLEELLRDFPQDTAIYERLLHNYEKEGDTESIIRLSQQSSTTAASALFGEYVSDDPEFNIDSGSYFEPQTIRLMCTGNGSIYYTTDGREPDKNSDIYKSPIKIDEGETTISAIHINEKGVSSNVVSKTYTVKIITPEVPRIITQAGDYRTPTLIKVADPDAGTVYYTNDGTDPTLDNARVYEPPLPMPLGKSEYRFAIINDSGVSSEVVSAKYNLKLDAAVDVNTAQAGVQLRLTALGHMVLDHEFVAKYGYYANDRSYYVVEEYAETDGKKVRQNTLYAVDALTGEIFTLTRNTKNGDYDFGIVI